MLIVGTVAHALYEALKFRGATTIKGLIKDIQDEGYTKVEYNTVVKRLESLVNAGLITKDRKIYRMVK